jgi:integrase
MSLLVVMKNNNTNPDNQQNQKPNPGFRQGKTPPAKTPPERTDEAGYQKLPLQYRPLAGRAQRDPIDYDSHPYPAMKQFAGFLVLRFNTPRTRHSYYRQMRLVHEFCQTDPALIAESEYRDYILHVKTVKRWKPKTIRQAAASAKLFFMEMLGLQDWKVFSQIRAKDEKTLPAVLTRSEVIRLLKHIRLRRYRIPLKLIYCCGLRVSECLSLTIHDIDTTMIYLHLTHRSEQDSRALVEKLCEQLPR